MATPPDQNLYLDIRQLSTLSGLSITTLRRYASKGKIEALQPGGRGGKLLFRPNALERSATCQGGDNQEPLTPPSNPTPGRLSGRKPAWMSQSVESPNPES